ncbi:hypothetical protein MTR_7g461370 [Medicago truncatula]|uniref:Uncharacterized protein n=1 Tax=Medicago truncatula TaxID=3880 RepID=A0A072TZI3_MEDTR|nr:hypothetical protein MTR_7g461370 [Medicago truncatula]
MGSSQSKEKWEDTHTIRLKIQRMMHTKCLTTLGALLLLELACWLKRFKCILIGVEYRCPLSDSAGSLRFVWMKLTNDDDVRTMFSVFGQHNTRGPIKLDASLVRSAEQIKKSLIRPRNYEEIRALLEGPEEEHFHRHAVPLRKPGCDPTQGKRPEFDFDDDAFPKQHFIIEKNISLVKNIVSMKPRYLTRYGYDTDTVIREIFQNF